MTNNIEFESGAIRPTECISEGWEKVKENYGLFFGISLVAMLIVACVPCVNIFIAGPVMVGVYICNFKLLRNEPVEFGNMFKGFEVFVPAMVVGIIQMIPEIIGQGIRFSIDMADLGLKINQPMGGKDFYMAQDSTISSGLVILGVAVGLFFMIFNIFWRILFQFAIPLIAENQNLSIGDALKLSIRAGWANAGMIFVLGLLEGLMLVAGVFALCIGFLFVLPIINAANAVAYRQVFPDRNPNNQMYNTPPPPSAYQNQF